MNTDLLAETAVEIHEIERRLDAEIEIRRAHVSVSAFVMDDNAKSAKLAPVNPDNAHLVEDSDTPLASYTLENVVCEHPVLHRVVYVARIRFRSRGQATSSGWPATTAEGCARFLIHEFNQDFTFNNAFNKGKP